MKTISGKPISEKPISLSKAAKVLSKFISAENGASHVINAYLQRASSSFSELNQLHKELKLPYCDRKHKRSRSETCDDKEKIEENYIPSVEVNEEPNHLAVHQFGSKNPGDEAEKSQGTKYDAGTEFVSERLKKKKKKHDIKLQEQGGHGVKIEEVEAVHKPLAEAVNGNEEKPTIDGLDFSQEPVKKKKKKHNIKLQEQGGHGVKTEEVEAVHKPLTEAVNGNEEKPTIDGLDFSQEPVEREKRKKKTKHEDDYSKHAVAEVKSEEGSDEGNAGDDIEGMEEGNQHKKEKKKKKKDRDIMNNFSDKEGKVSKPEDVEYRNGDLIDLKELLDKKKRRHMAGSEDKINTDELKKVHKKRKNEDLEGIGDDKSGEPIKKKIKKRHGGDD